MQGLILHCGSHAATLEQIAAVPTPEPTVSHYPIPHVALVRHVRGQLLDAGVTITEEAFGLSADGARMFGVLALNAERLPTVEGSRLVLALRNAHDKAYCAGLALGNSVLCCDNLSFIGTRTLARKHTRYIQRDLPGLIARILGQLGDWARRQAERFSAYQDASLNDPEAHDFMVRAIRGRVIAPSRLLHVIDAWDRPDQAHSLWMLFNAFTEALRGTIDVPELARRTEKLHGLADLEVERLHHVNGNGHAALHDSQPLGLPAPAEPILK